MWSSTRTEPRKLSASPEYRAARKAWEDAYIAFHQETLKCETVRLRAGRHKALRKALARAEAKFFKVCDRLEALEAKPLVDPPSFSTPTQPGLDF